MTVVRKLEAACHQLDWAIRLFLDHGQPLPAITLASAAEELLGKRLGENSAHEELIKIFMSSHGFDRKSISQSHLNRAKNWLKHWDHPGEDEEAEFDLDREAFIAITRALSNMLQYNRSLPSEGPRFVEWAVEHPLDGP
jgi:hypothetical protein